MTIDYPDAPAAPSFVIYEKNFGYMKVALMHEQDQKLTGVVAASKKATAAAAAKEHSAEEKKAIRTKELLKEYQIMRGLPFTLTIKTRFNLPEEVEQVKKEPEVVIDPKKKKWINEMNLNLRYFL